MTAAAPPRPSDPGTGLSLATRYALASGLVLALAALLIGGVISARIEQTVVRNTANATALYMESFISPISQQLAENDDLSDGAKRALDELFRNTPLGERVVSYKIWRPDGRIVHGSNPDQVGQVYPLTDSLRQAFAGQVSAEFEDLGDEEDANEHALGLPLLEIYSPIREVWTGEIIAVGEFYEANAALRSDLRAARFGAWAAVVGIVLSLGAVLYVIVLGGSRTIETQRRRLDAQLDQLRDLSARNVDLRLRVQGAAARAAAQNEVAMRRIGADLHDGPAQHIAFAALRLDALRDAVAGAGTEAELDRVKTALDTALSEVRGLSRGLSLPEIAGRPIPDIVRAAIEAHQLRHGTEIDARLACDTAPDLTEAARICIFRFVQEGLTNATRHADGVGVSVTLDCTPDRLSLAIADRGPGLPSEPRGQGLGLSGLRDRVEALGGRFSAGPRPGGGTEIRMILDPETAP